MTPRNETPVSWLCMGWPVLVNVAARRTERRPRGHELTTAIRDPSACVCVGLCFHFICILLIIHTIIFSHRNLFFYHLQSAIMYLALIVRFKWRISLVTKNPSWPNTPIMKKMLLSMISSSTMLLLIFSSNSLPYSVHTDDWMFKYHSEKCGHVIDCIYGGSIYKQENISERISTCVLMHDRIILENMFLSIFPSSTTLTFNGKHNI